MRHPAPRKCLPEANLEDYLLWGMQLYLSLFLFQIVLLAHLINEVSSSSTIKSSNLGTTRTNNMNDFDFDSNRLEVSIIENFSDFDPYELYTMLRLRSEIFVCEQNCIFLDLDNEDQKCIHMLAWYRGLNDEKILVGYLRIFPPTGDKDGGMTRIGRVAVDMNYRSKGLGKKLMMDAIKLSSSRWKNASIKIGAQEHLDNFYGSGTKEKPGLGFRRVSEM